MRNLSKAGLLVLVIIAYLSVLPLTSDSVVKAKDTAIMPITFQELLGVSLTIPKGAEVRVFSDSSTAHVYIPDEMLIILQKVPSIMDAASESWIQDVYMNYLQESRTLFLDNQELVDVKRYILPAGLLGWQVTMANGMGDTVFDIVALENGEEQLIILDTLQNHRDDIYRNLLESIGLPSRSLHIEEHITEADNKPMDIAKINVPIYLQTDPAWRCEQLGTCTCKSAYCGAPNIYTIWDAGCFMTSQAMIFQYYMQGSYMNPSQYNQCIKNVNGYRPLGECGNCALPSYNTIAGCTPNGVTWYKYYTTTLAPLNFSIIDNDLMMGYPVLGGMKNPDTGVYHYYVIIGKVGNDCKSKVVMS